LRLMPRIGVRGDMIDDLRLIIVAEPPDLRPLLFSFCPFTFAFRLFTSSLPSSNGHTLEKGPRTFSSPGESNLAVPHRIRHCIPTAPPAKPG
jgi:hypothetical protein